MSFTRCISLRMRFIRNGMNLGMLLELKEAILVPDLLLVGCLQENRDFFYTHLIFLGFKNLVARQDQLRIDLLDQSN